MIWKVKVLCEGWGKTNSGRKRSYRHWVTCLVEAKDSDEAFGNGIEFAYMQAPIGPKWDSIEAREAINVSLPVLI